MLSHMRMRYGYDRKPALQIPYRRFGIYEVAVGGTRSQRRSPRKEKFWKRAAHLRTRLELFKISRHTVRSRLQPSYGRRELLHMRLLDWREVQISLAGLARFQAAGPHDAHVAVSREGLYVAQDTYTS
jgi:hypothetical protein